MRNQWRLSIGRNFLRPRVHPGTVKDLAAKPSSVPSRTVFALATCAASYHAQDGLSRLDLAERPVLIGTSGNFEVRDE